MQEIVDSGPEGQYFGIVGWDARGTGAARARLECFPDYLSRQYWMAMSKAEGTLGGANVSYATRWARQQSLMQSCVSRAAEDPASIARFMNSRPVVEDIVAITERHREWREDVTQRFIDEAGARQSTRVQHRQTAPPALLHERNKWRKGEEKVMTWGVSCGTVLGQLFATTHPHRVSRMLLDSVVDHSTYLSSRSPWEPLIEDTESIFDSLFSYCARFTACPFHDVGESALRARFVRLLASDIRPSLTQQQDTPPQTLSHSQT